MRLRVTIPMPDYYTDGKNAGEISVPIPVPSVSEYNDPDFNLFKSVADDTRVTFGVETMRWRDLPLNLAQALVEKFWQELGKEATSLARRDITPPTE